MLVNWKVIGLEVVVHVRADRLFVGGDVDVAEYWWKVDEVVDARFIDMTFQLHHEQLSVFGESFVARDDGLDIVVVVVVDFDVFQQSTWHVHTSTGV